jgi:ribonuclease HII
MSVQKTIADFTFERAARLRGARLVAGVDEAGRGPLAGPVVAAAVILDPGRLSQGLADSKTLSAAQRERLFAEIKAMAEVAVGSADLDEIDRLNILGASLLAMERAVAGLPRPPDHVLVDGNRLPPGLRGRAETIVRGDARSLSIAAASIIAKVTRDRIMVDLAQQFPGYGWEVNAGYPTPGHLKALLDLGVSAAHRRSFRPVHNILYQDKSVSR